MLVRITGAKCVGIDAVKVVVELDVVYGIGIHLVGLADIAVKESLLRTTTALQALGYRIPGKRIVINLAPADLRKNGSGYDLPIAVGILAASQQAALKDPEGFLIMGELALDGSVRGIPGALAMAQMASEEGMRGVILPLESALEAVDFTDIPIYGVRTLGEVVEILSSENGSRDLLVRNTREYMAMEENRRKSGTEVASEVDFADIIGQEGAKRGMEIAAAGGHNMIMVGTPGSGKSSLAKAMSGILPPLSADDALTVSKIYSAAGKKPAKAGLLCMRPFRSPHYSASMAAMVGGGGGDAILPGEVSLAHSGVLFLDEFGQMPRSVVEALRAPLEDGKVVVSRLRAKIEFPARFMLVAASNPCPCGYYGEGDRCICTPQQRLNYLSRLSGPVMDRIDIQVWMRPVDRNRILSGARAESSSAVAERVRNARERQKERFASEDGMSLNARMSNRHIAEYCPLDEECRNTLDKIMSASGLSMRAYFRIIKVARTIADLAMSEPIRPEHLLEAAGYRFLDRCQK